MKDITQMIENITISLKQKAIQEEIKFYTGETVISKQTEQIVINHFIQKYLQNISLMTIPNLKTVNPRQDLERELEDLNFGQKLQGVSSDTETAILN